MRFISTFDDNSGADKALNISRIVMLIYITSNIVLTLSQGCHAASLSSIKNQQNVEKNGTAKDTQSNSSLKGKRTILYTDHSLS